MNYLSNRFKIQRSILLVLVFVIITIALFVKLISSNMGDTRSTDYMVSETYEITKRIETIEAGVAETEADTRAFIATGDRRWLTNFTTAEKEVFRILAETRDRIHDNEQQKRLDELEQVIRRKFAAEEAAIRTDTLAKQLLDMVSYDGEDRLISLRIKKVINQLRDRQDELLQQRVVLSSKAKNKALLTAIIGSAVVFIFILGTLLTLNRDVIRRKKAEQEIRESESKYRQMIEEAGVTMFTSDFNGNFTYVSSRCESLTGYTAAELTGKNFSLLVLPDYLENVIALYMSQVRSEQHESTIEFPIITREGHLKWVEQNAVLLYNESLEICGYQCVVKDITEKKQSEQLLKNADQKIRAMLSSTQEGFYMIASDYSITMVNEAGQRMLKMMSGKECELGNTILDFIRPERIETFKETFARVMKGSNEEMETHLETAEGEKWYHNTYFGVRNEEDRVIAICSSSKDITERKLAEKALDKIRVEREEYQFRLQSILDNTPSIVFVKDLQGRYLLINKSFREVFNRTEAEVIGKTDFDFDTMEDAAAYRKTDEEVITTLRSIELEETFHCPRRGIQNLFLVKFPLFDKNNNIYGVGGIATDFTENVQYRQKLIEAKKKAESAEQLQEQFLANMSHEIRTPMNGITGMTNILMSTKLDEQQKEFVKIIRQSSDNLLFLINDILDLSKIKAGKLTLEKTTFSLKEVISNTLAPFHLKAKEKKIDLLLVQSNELPTMVEGDPYRLNQILNNLLSNAMKFTDSGSVTLSVKQITQSPSDTILEFAVSDTGIGVAAEKLNSIFNSFEQANESTTRQYGGTGLGLSITKQLVEMQGGQIGIQSELGKGTTFHFAIRYDIKNENVDDTIINETTDNTALAGKKILVVEDNEINQKVIFHVLQKEGMQMQLANNGREAATLLEQGQSFDLIIMDLQMPIMDGFQATTYIRKKLQSKTPIIAMTASVLRNEKVKCFELGMNEYLSKPFVPAELFATLKRMLFVQANAQPAINGSAFSSQQAKHAAPQTSVSYSLDYLKEMDDNEYLCEILQLFLETTPVILDEVRHEVLHENWDMVAKKAHKLKSNLGVLQVNDMLELIAGIEQRAKTNVETSKIEGDVKRATEQFSLIRPMIEAELNAALQV